MAKYRLANIQDVTALAALRYRYWVEDGEDAAEVSEDKFIGAFTARISEAFEQDELFCWLATIDKKIVSTLYVQVVRKLPKPSKVVDQFGYATNFYTIPEQRGHGIGRMLLRKTKQWALSVDLEFIIAWPSEDSTRLWKSEAFKENESVVCDIRPYVN
ncbi:MAG: GNAT family N-acetyltransferase [Marinicella sp.]